jgi:hypothetical protein
VVADPFAEPLDVETALLRPLTDTELVYVPGLLQQASDQLRNKAPSIDNRIAWYLADRTNPAGVSPGVVASVIAGVVKRYMSNPRGWASETETVGIYSTSHSYALRGEKETRGALQVTDDDLRELFPNRKRLRVGSLRLQPALAPRPVGRYGPLPGPVEALEAEITFGQRSRPLVLGEQDGTVLP